MRMVCKILSANWGSYSFINLNNAATNDPISYGSARSSSGVLRISYHVCLQVSKLVKTSSGTAPTTPATNATATVEPAAIAPIKNAVDDAALAVFSVTPGSETLTNISLLRCPGPVLMFSPFGPYNINPLGLFSPINLNLSCAQIPRFQLLHSFISSLRRFYAIASKYRISTYIRALNAATFSARNTRCYICHAKTQ